MASFCDGGPFLFSADNLDARQHDGEPEIQAVPGNAGYLSFSGGTAENANFSQSTNGGTTWTGLSGVTNVWCHGYGAVAPGYTYPTLWLIGSKGGVLGLWKSRDLGVSDWLQITAWPYSPDQANAIWGDPSDSTKLYIAFGNSSAGIGTNLA